MRLASTILTSTLLLAPLAQAEITSETITLGSADAPFIGTLTTPSADPAPVVLLLHGFTGTRDELQTDFVKDGVFAHTAARLADQGFASLRIDFRGSGDSTKNLTYAQTTFEGQVADALTALDYLKSSDAVQGDELHIIGWSQGGAVATAAAGRRDDLDVVALWAAAADLPATFGGLFGSEILTKGMNAAPDETVSFKLPWGADVALNGAFFDGIETFKPLSEIAAYSGPLFVAQGSLDTTVPPANAEALIDAHDGPETLWSAEMDHVFNTFTTGETLNQLIDATTAYFKSNDD